MACEMLAVLFTLQNSTILHQNRNMLGVSVAFKKTDIYIYIYILGVLR